MKTGRVGMVVLLGLLAGCGKKGDECKTLTTSFNAGVEELNDAKKDLGSDVDKGIASMEAHIETANGLLAKLEASEPTTEGLKGAWSKAKEAAQQTLNAAKTAKANFETLKQIQQTGKRAAGDDAAKNAVVAFQKACESAEADADEAACAGAMQALVAMGKSAGDLDGMSAAVEALAASKPADASIAAAHAQVVAEMKKPLQLVKDAKAAKAEAEAAKKELASAKEAMDGAAEAITSACK